MSEVDSQVGLAQSITIGDGLDPFLETVTFFKVVPLSAKTEWRHIVSFYLFTIQSAACDG